MIKEMFLKSLFVHYILQYYIRETALKNTDKHNNNKCIMNILYNFYQRIIDSDLMFNGTLNAKTSVISIPNKDCIHHQFRASFYDIPMVSIIDNPGTIKKQCGTVLYRGGGELTCDE